MERDIVNAITRLLTARNAWWIKIHGNQYGQAGTPDLMVVYRGIPIVLEVKTPTGKTTRLQDFHLKKAGEAGAKTATVRSARQVNQILDTIDEERDWRPPTRGSRE